jgi:hypothetical protein
MDVSKASLTGDSEEKLGKPWKEIISIRLSFPHGEGEIALSLVAILCDNTPDDTVYAGW